MLDVFDLRGVQFQPPYSGTRVKEPTLRSGPFSSGSSLEMLCLDWSFLKRARKVFSRCCVHVLAWMRYGGVSSAEHGHSSRSHIPAEGERTLFPGGADLLLLCDPFLSRRLRNLLGNSFMVGSGPRGGEEVERRDSVGRQWGG